MIKKPADITRPADLQGHDQGTGPVRSQYPVYKDFLPPCNNACPAGENIQAWLALVQAGTVSSGMADSDAGQSDAVCAWPGLLPPLRTPMQQGATGWRCQHPCRREISR